MPVEHDDATIHRFVDWLRNNDRAAPEDYAELHAWSVADLDGFWRAVWEFFHVGPAVAPGGALPEGRLPGAEWFPGTRLNYAEHVFRNASPSSPALIWVDETGAVTEWSWARLAAETAAFAEHLRRCGVSRGDRVVGYLPNVPEAVVALLASASIGAVWAACNPDVAPRGVVDRFAGLEPTVLVATDGSRYGGREHDRREALAQIRAELPSVRATVVIPRVNADPVLAVDECTWAQATADGDAELRFEQLPFDHPLWVLFSSGTTGVPKGIVQGHGGILLEHVKTMALHLDLGPGDRFFWPCSTTWVVWNLLVSGLVVGATAVLYDGSPTEPSIDRVWRITDEQRVTRLGISPAYLQSCAKEELRLRPELSLASLRAVSCSGAPVPLAAYEWLGQQLPDVPLESMSGGTDVAAAFVGGCPLLPVYPGENAAPCLGVAVEAWDDAGQPVREQVGELVITKPMPSMPLSFWGDSTGERFRQTYFDHFPGVWRHGDWITMTDRGSVIVHGRSDATLNRNGVRLGSAEIYQAIEGMPEIVEALVVGVEQPGGEYWLPLFVQLAAGVTLDEALRDRIVSAIRTQASSRHVPDEILSVEAFPHTLTGKRLEVPIKRILLGADPEDVLNPAAVGRPELLDAFVAVGRAKRGPAEGQQIPMEPGLRKLVDDAAAVPIPPMPAPWPGPGQAHEDWVEGVRALREQHEQASVERAEHLAAQAPPASPPPVASVSDVEIPVEGATITARLYTPEGDGPFPALVAFHGGGFWIGGGKVGLDAADVGCRSLCLALSSVVVNVDYRQAPEHRFPGPLEDCYAATQWVVDHAAALNVDAERISITGASAGANLAMGVALTARDRGGPALRSQLLLVPAVDPTLQYVTNADNKHATDITDEAVAAAWDYYFGPDGDRTDPRAALLNADLSNLPPTHIVVGDFDPLRDEGVALAERLQQAGVDATLARHAMTHGLAEPGVGAAYVADAVAAVQRANEM